MDELDKCRDKYLEFEAALQDLLQFLLANHGEGASPTLEAQAILDGISWDMEHLQKIEIMLRHGYRDCCPKLEPDCVLDGIVATNPPYDIVDYERGEVSEPGDYIVYDKWEDENGLCITKENCSKILS